MTSNQVTNQDTAQATETKKTPSRQSVWQQKQREKGLCVLCNTGSADGYHCGFHRETNRIRSRNRYRKKHNLEVDPIPTRAEWEASQLVLPAPPEAANPQ